MRLMTKKSILVYKEELLKLKQEIAGEICINEAPGNALKKWQNIFEISQLSLARAIGITSSTISDYQNGRRNNPSIKFVSKFVNALIDIDIKRKGNIIRKLITLPQEQLIETKEFKKAIKIKHTDGLKDFIQINSKHSTEPVYGITFIDEDSIPEIEQNDLQKVYGKTNKRILYFTNVTNPLVIYLFVKTLKIYTNLYPSIIVLETSIDEKDEILKVIDFNLQLFISENKKEEIKNKIKEL